MCLTPFSLSVDEQQNHPPHLRRHHRRRRGCRPRARVPRSSRGKIDPHHLYGTINCDGVNAKGEICGVTNTSGLAWKISGRVGDSPILGAGLYVDGDGLHRPR